MSRKRVHKQTVESSRKVVAGVAAAAPRSIDGEPFRWAVDEADFDYAGAWDWDLKPAETRHMLEILANAEGKTWREIKAERAASHRHNRAKHHAMPLEDLCPEAQSRLVERQVDADALFRFRNGNMMRLWGYLQGSTFKVLWFDRGHAVCPTDKD